MSEIDEREILRRLEALSQVRPDPNSTAQAMDRTRQALETSEAQRDYGHIRIWSFIMKNKIAQIAAAVIVLAAVLVGIKYFGGSIDGGSVAWAEIVQQVEQSYDDYYAKLLSAMEEKGKPTMPVVSMGCSLSSPLENVCW